MDEQDESAAKVRVVHKDQGWSWVVLVAGFLVYGVGFGMVCAYGVYTQTWKEAFNATNKEAAAVSSVSYSLIPLTGPISAIFYQKAGARLAVMTGSVVSMLGYFLSWAASTSIYHLTVYQGMVGFGFGLQVVSAMSVQGEYFDSRLSFALALVPSAVALIMFVLPNVYLAMIREFGWEQSMLVNAGIASLGIGAAVVMRPNDPRARVGKLSGMFNFGLFRSARMPLFCISSFCWAGGSYTYYSQINLLTTSRYIDLGAATNVIVANGVVDLLSRLAVAGVSFLCPHADRLAGYAVGNGILGLAIIISGLCESLASFIGLGCLFGLGFGSMIACFGAVMVDMFGLKDFPAVQAFAFLFGGTGAIVIPLVAGALADAYGEVRVGFFFAGAMGVLGALCSALVWIIRRREPVPEPIIQKEQNVALTDLNDQS